MNYLSFPNIPCDFTRKSKRLKICIPLVLIGFLCVAMACEHPTANTEKRNDVQEVVLPFILEPAYITFFNENKGFRAEGFDYPVGIPDGDAYYNAQPFGKNNHLGDDWNGVGGGNSDLGDPVYSIANGYVSSANDEGPGWGNVLRIIHQISDTVFVESLYAHLDTISVSEGTGIYKGNLIGEIGNANGAYWAHLHLEVRENLDLPVGGGYSSNTSGYVDPTKFISENRRVMWRPVKR